MSRVYEPDRIKVDIGDWEYAASYETCGVCGIRMIEHAPVEGYPWLRRMCDGSFFKLRG